jgi:hypothetical protein
MKQVFPRGDPNDLKVARTMTPGAEGPAAYLPKSEARLTAAPLPRVLSIRVLERGTSLGKPGKHIREGPWKGPSHRGRPSSLIGVACQRSRADSVHLTPRLALPPCPPADLPGAALLLAAIALSPSIGYSKPFRPQPAQSVLTRDRRVRAGR